MNSSIESMFHFQIHSDSANSEARNQFDITVQMSGTVQQAENLYKQEDYSKTIELLTGVIEV